MAKPIKNIPGRISSLFQQAIVALTREIKALSQLSARGKLPDIQAKHLIGYIKLLADLQKINQEIKKSDDERNKQRVAALTDEEILKHT